MGEDSQLPESMETRPRFQIVDLLAIIAAVAIGFGLARAIGNPPDIVADLIASLIFSAAFVPPLVIAAQFVRKRRRRSFDWKDATGIVPCAAVMVFLLASTSEDLNLLRGLALVLSLLLVGNALIGFALLANDQPKSAWHWTDWYGCVLATAIGLLLGLGYLFAPGVQ